MTINKAKLIELLVERTGLEKEKIEEQLLQLIMRIQQAAGQGKSFQIEGLGTFNVNEDTLHFDPADTLETEINHKYAGMKPIELIGAFKEVPAAEEEESEAVSMPEDQMQKESSAGEDLMEKIKEMREELSKPPVPLKEPVADHIEQSGGEEESKTSFIFDAESAIEEQRPENEEPAATTQSAKREKEKSKDPIGTVITIFVIILVIGVSGWLIYDLGLLSALNTNMQLTGQKEQTVQSASGQPGDPLTESSSDQSSSSLTKVNSEGETDQSASEQQRVNTVSGKEDTDTPVETAAYGLMGTASTRGNDGYTIVVHSLGSKSTSRGIQENLESEGYRTVLTSALVNGSTFWRIGLGQFETVSDAQKAVRMLPEQYKSNHFIKRIQ